MADDILKEGREAFELSAEGEADNRRDAEDDIRFARLADQWPEQIRRQRELDGRPCLTINRLPSFIRQVVNDARQNKPAIKVHPADDGADPETAKVINGIIRNIEYTSNADVAYDTALESAVTGGFGYFTVDTQYASDDTFDLDLVIRTVADPFCIYGDPYDTGSDSSEWSSAFETQMLSRKAFERRFKGADPVDWAEYDDLDGDWCEGRGEGQRVRLAKWWRREAVKRRIVLLSNGTVMAADDLAANIELVKSAQLEVVGERDTEAFKVTWSLMTGAEVVDKGDWAGRYIPIIPVYGDVVQLGGKRHLRSMIRDAKDPQRNMNFWRSASTELVALAPKAPFIGPQGAFETDADKWATANTESHAYIEYDGPMPPQRQPFASVPAGALQEAMNASDDLKSILGMFDASLGAASNETSGRAILARQREGDVGTFHFVDNLARSIRHAGRILIDLIPSVYSQPRIMRVMGEDEHPTNVQVNQPFQAPQMGPDGKPAMQEGGVTPQTVERLHDLTIGKYDLVVKAGPSFTTKREEAANQMIELTRANPAAGPLIADLLAKNLDWPEADEIARRFEGLRKQQDPKAAAAAQAQGEMAKLQMQGQQKQAQMQQDADLKRQQMMLDQEIAREKMAGELALRREQVDQEIALARAQSAAEVELEREKITLRAQTDLINGQRTASEEPTVGSDVEPGGDPG